MTYGAVNPFRYAEVEVTVRAGSGKQDKSFNAIIDTGFNGAISLPPDLIAELDLPYFDRKPAIVFGGTQVKFDVYWAVVVLGDREIEATAIAADNPPLIGMNLLYGFELFIDVVDGGKVTLTPRPLEPVEEKE